MAKILDPHFRRALDFVRPYGWALAPVVILSLLGTGLGLVLPYLSKLLVDDALVAQDFDALLNIVGLFVGITAASFLMNVLSGMRYTKVSADILFDMRLDLYRHLQRLSPRYYAKTPLGDVVSRINGDIGEIQRVTAEATLAWLGQLIALVGTVGMLIYLDIQLFFAGLITLPPALFALLRYRRQLEARVRDLRERSADIGTFLIETLQGMRAVVGANAQEREVDRFRNKNDSFIDALLSMRLFTYLAGGLPGLLLTTGTGIVFLYGGYRVINGATTLGTFVAFMAYQMRLMAPIQGLMGLYSNLATARASLVRVHEIRDSPPEVIEAAASKSLPVCKGEVTLEEVHYGFGRGGEVLAGVNLVIPAGQVLAIVGTSGSGKSTIADLLSRQLDPDEGRILLDGNNLCDLFLAQVRRHIVVVEQSPFIFHATVAENVRYARPEATEADVRQAIHAAGLSDLMDSMPEDLNTVVGERGSQLSAGERQRVAIARAYLAEPSVLIFDEATGALDPMSEAAVLSGYDALMRGRTTVLITHRIDLARQADRVVVLKNGRVAEDGRLSDLETRGTAFRDIFLDVKTD
ncbi:MAG: ABC transporter ATP-binding protein [Gemmatimonadota bacterium]|nr:ABC transporter ATP-binding protein [Gemmatimonadota bacterium]MEC9317045.1 ABC transporter ATP-binding protein [Gemmatimonadota bacterium]